MNSLTVGGGAVERIYNELKTQAICYAMKPGSRLNEGELARSLGVSRTPLREALNRLATAGFLSFEPTKGYFRKPLDAVEILDLYEMRQAVESAAVQLAAERASDAALAEIGEYLADSMRADQECGVDELVRFDEGFHERIVALAGNAEMLASLRNINDRIRFFRWIDMESERRRGTQEEHRLILETLKRRNGAEAARLLHAHVAQRRDQIVSRVREGYARIYVDGGEPT
ncbi:MAG: hypothetical protein RL684_2592 [Pseudomonadota bacterium]|jgi:DNA-binding GntR family transcriptional regulator